MLRRSMKSQDASDIQEIRHFYDNNSITYGFNVILLRCKTLARTDESHAW